MVSSLDFEPRIHVKRTFLLHISRERFGAQAMVNDPSHIGSNREAASKHFTVASVAA